MGLAALVYAGTFDHGLVYDDGWTRERLAESGGATWWDLLWSSRGLTYLVHRADAALWGDWLPGWHLTNVGLHALATFLATGSAALLADSRRVGLACGLFFAVHPVHVEAVASVSYRKDLLAASCALGALWLWLGPPRSAWRYGGALLCLQAGLLAKEVAAIGLVPMLVAADLLSRTGRPQDLRGRLRSACRRGLPLLALGLVASAVALGWGGRLFDRSRLQERIHPQVEGYDDVLATALASTPQVAQLLVFPTTLSADYLTPLETSPFAPRPALGAALVGAWIAFGVALVVGHGGTGMGASWRAPAGFAVLWVFVTWVPCSNLVPLTHFFVADRYLYLPSYGICLLFALVLERALARTAAANQAVLRLVVATGAVALFAFFVVRTAVRSSEWRDSYAVWSSALREGQRTARVHNNLGTALFERGQYDAAIHEFRSALRVESDHKLASLNLGNALLAAGRYAEAESALLRVLTAEPANPRAYHGLAVALSALGRNAEAIEAEQQAIVLDPDYADALHWLGVLLAREGRLEGPRVPERGGLD